MSYLQFPTESLQLPQGVRQIPLEEHCDDRGVLTEVFRAAWVPEVHFRQWNAVRSGGGALRGVHVHLRHSDYLILLQGRALFCLRDLRRGSPTFGLSAAFVASGERLAALMIPPGVAHGFYFYEDSLHVYAVSEYWDPQDELGCRFDDPDLDIRWPDPAPRISPRDAQLKSLRELLAVIPEYQSRKL